MYLKHKNIEEILEDQTITKRAKKRAIKRLSFTNFAFNRITTSTSKMYQVQDEEVTQGTKVDFFTMLSLKKEYKETLKQANKQKLLLKNSKFDSMMEEKYKKLSSLDNEKHLRRSLKTNSVKKINN